MIRPTKRQRFECPPSWLDCATLQAVPTAATSTTNTKSQLTDASRDDDGMLRTPMASPTTKDIFLDRLRKEVVDKYKFSAATPKTMTATGGGTAVGSNKDSSDGNATANDSAHSQQRIRRLLRRRIAIGLNECTRALESAVGRQPHVRGTTMNHRHLDPTEATSEVGVSAIDGRVESVDVPLLIVVAAEGMRPSPLPMVHLPVLARELGVPLLLLPDASTRRELGRILGIKSASILTFLSRPSSPKHDSSADAGASRSSLGDSESTSGAADGDYAADDPDDIRQANAGLDSFIEFVCGKVEAAPPRTAPASAR